MSNEMNTKSHAERAKENFLQGFNCAQAVFLAFTDLTGFTPDEAARISAPFGAGMGRMREVCGAVTGALMVVGALYGYPDGGEESGEKVALYREVQAFFSAFTEKEGEFLCHALLGLPKGPDVPKPEIRTPDYYDTRPCPRIIYNSAALLDAFIASHPIGKPLADQSDAKGADAE